MDAMQQTALDLAKKIRDTENYDNETKADIIYGMVRLSLAVGGYSFALENIWNEVRDAA